jgi:hypothetical protein
MAQLRLPVTGGLLVLVALLGASGCGSGATTAGAVLAVTSVYAAPGQTISIPVTLTGADGADAFKLTISYNAGNLTLTSVTEGAGLPAASVFTNSSTPGMVNVALTGTTAFSTSPTAQLLVMNFVFSSLSPTGTVNDLTITSASVTNSSGTALAISPLSGSITTFS